MWVNSTKFNFKKQSFDETRKALEKHGIFILNKKRGQNIPFKKKNYKEAAFLAFFFLKRYAWQINKANSENKNRSKVKERIGEIYSFIVFIIIIYIILSLYIIIYIIVLNYLRTSSLPGMTQ